MKHGHEYSVFEHSRATIGSLLGLIAALVSGLAANFAAWGLERFGEDALAYIGTATGSVQVVVWPLTAGTVFSVLYFVFNKYGWQWKWINSMLGVPDFRGEWSCNGDIKNKEDKPIRDFSGTVKISQSWTKISVQMKTEHSDSKSICASIQHSSDDIYELNYSYKNEPNAQFKAEPSEFEPHTGFCRMFLSKNGEQTSASFYSERHDFNIGSIKLKLLGDKQQGVSDQRRECDDCSAIASLLSDPAHEDRRPEDILADVRKFVKEQAKKGDKDRLNNAS